MRIISIIILLVFGSNIYGQDSPSSEVSQLNKVDLYKLPALNNETLNKRYKADKQTAYRFAEAREVHINPVDGGTWEEVSNDVMVWRQRILSPNAYTLNLGFTEFYLPESAKLFLYNADKSEIIGPLTKSDNDDHMSYWTPMLGGEEIVIELQIRADEIMDYKLLLSKVNHDFADIRKSLSGSCNVDVVCGAADGYEIIDDYRDIISSVGAYTLNGTDQCTGTLINNTNNDCRPYFLTAHHCEIEDTDAHTVVVFWNFENSTCRRPGSAASGGIGNGLRNQFNSGSVIRASLDGDGGNDFMLIELDDPIDPALNLHFAGWNRGVELPDTSICIHHPNVEEKRISFDFDPIVNDFGLGPDSTYIRVLDWDIGTTEPGSSGSGIFNTNKELIGQLTGGLAACNNDRWDRYGWFRYSWEGEGQPTNSLKSWLDPAGTGATRIAGRGCSYDLQIANTSFEVCGNTRDQIRITMMPEGLFLGDLTYSLIGFPNSLNASFDSNTLSATESNALTVSGISSSQTGTFSFDIMISDGTNEVSKEINLFIFEDIPEIPNIIAPENNLGDAPLTITLSIDQTGGKENIFQIATDNSFTNIISEQIVTTNEILLGNLSQNQEYFWRVKAKNICGESEWTDTYSFKTGKVYCTIISASDLPIEISEDGRDIISSKIDFPYGANIEDVNILNVNGTHSFVGDLRVSLKYNNMLSVLFASECLTNDDFNLGFDDQSNLATIDCPPTSGDIFQPASALSVFNGLFAAGEWQIEIEDQADGDGGSFESWEMQICYSNAIAPILIPENKSISFCESQQLVIESYINTGSVTDYDLIVTDPSGTLLNSTYKIDDNDNNSVTITIDDVTSQESQVFIQIIDNADNSVIYFTELDLEYTGTSPIAEVIFPVDGSTVNAIDFNTINWDSNNFFGDFIVEIASDENFNDIVFSMTGSDNLFINIDATSFADGNYFIRVGQLSPDCGFVFSENVSFELTESVTGTDNLNKPDFLIYPNPSTSLFYIKTSGFDMDEYEVKLFDVKGSLVEAFTQKVADNLYSLDITNEANGLYLIEFSNQEKVSRHKIIKIR